MGLPDKTTVGVFGAAGRMGATVCNAVAADPQLELVAAVDPGNPGAICFVRCLEQRRAHARNQAVEHWCQVVDPGARRTLTRPASAAGGA